MNNDWFKKCPVCKGKGEVRSSHPLAIPQQGYANGTHGHSGEILVEPNLSYCGKCGGSGIKVIKK